MWCRAHFHVIGCQRFKLPRQIIGDIHDPLGKKSAAPGEAHSVTPRIFRGSSRAGLRRSTSYGPSAPHDPTSSAIKKHLQEIAFRDMPRDYTAAAVYLVSDNKNDLRDQTNPNCSAFLALQLPSTSYPITYQNTSAQAPSPDESDGCRQAR